MAQFLRRYNSLPYRVTSEGGGATKKPVRWAWSCQLPGQDLVGQQGLSSQKAAEQAAEDYIQTRVLPEKKGDADAVVPAPDGGADAGALDD